MGSNPAYGGKLAVDAARRVEQHDAAKTAIQSDVQADLAGMASRTQPAEDGRLDAVAHGLRSKAVEEVVDDEREVVRGRRLARISQIVDYAFSLLYAFLGLRFALALLGARGGTAFVRFIVGVTDPFYAPFRGIVGSPTLNGGHVVLVPLLVGAVAYGLLHLGINRMLRVLAVRKTAL